MRLSAFLSKQACRKCFGLFTMLFFLCNFAEANRFNRSNHAHRKWLRFEEGKRTLVFFYSKDCWFSMKRHTQIEDISSYLDKYFIVHFVDYDSEKSLVEEFMVDGAPTLIFLRSDGEEYFRNVGFLIISNGEGLDKEGTIREFKLFYESESDIADDDLRYFLKGGMECKKAGEISEALLRKGRFDNFFKGLSKNKLKDKNSFYLRSEAYFQLKKINRARLFYLYGFIEENRRVDNPSFYGYIDKFEKFENIEYFFYLIESLIEKYPENYALFHDYASLAVKYNQNLVQALYKLNSIPKIEFHQEFYYSKASIMKEFGDCYSIKKLLVENEIEDIWKRRIKENLYERCIIQ